MTFKQAQQRILDHLEAEGWALQRKLKIPHATDPHGRVRLWFKPQAIYMDCKPFSFGAARSLHVDPRQVDPAGLIRYAETTCR